MTAVQDRLAKKQKVDAGLTIARTERSRSSISTTSVTPSSSSVSSKVSRSAWISLGCDVSSFGLRRPLARLNHFAGFTLDVLDQLWVDAP